MRLSTIRVRMLVAALVPVFLTVVIMVGVFWSGRVSDLGSAHQQQARLLVQKVALASEYGIFSGNATALQGVVMSVRKEPGVRFVAVLSPSGQVLAQSGTGAYHQFANLSDPTYLARQREQGINTVMEAVTSRNVQLDDLYASTSDESGLGVQVLGYAVVELSMEPLRNQERNLLMVAIGVGILGLLVGGMLALQLGERVVRPVMSISRRIQRIGQGDFQPQHGLSDSEPLIELHHALNDMAVRLAWGREELEQRVAAVTSELREKKEEAENATLAKSRFLAAASHDLRQPIHALGLFVARLSQYPMDVPMRQLVQHLDASVQAMQNLLDGLLDVSRLDAGAVTANVRPVNINVIFDFVRVSSTASARDKGIRLRVRPTTLWCHSDPVLLQRMVMNLAHNALRYTVQGSVLVRCRKINNGSHVRIDVMDSGVGIASEHQKDIFREFFQVGNAARDRTQGLGLGLNIVQRSARLLGHDVELKSALGCGTRFSIIVPLCSPQVVATSREVEALPNAPLGLHQGLEGVRVLVVEDDVTSRQAQEELLRSWGCEVCAVATAAMATMSVQQGFSVDVVVSDFRLGGESNGLDVIAQIRELLGWPVPACVVSGDTDSDLMQAARAASLTLLHKPVRPAKLRSLVRHLANATAAAREQAVGKKSGQEPRS
ncbi:ATP-binding protein [Curvibacter sp. APW13]|uniref:ATP-binding protein n=1 Tax=Curvibacter sp. APW13 TaxID=3077236 RepID=UPI0028E02394|nr:ATP-binding protein [Curvibacter sp. APW13]MDT8992234.1 ATP-binding protein [Curvibacter sp. APW13]